MPAPERSQFEAGITNEQAVQLAPALLELVQHPAWALFQELLHAAKLRAREEGFAHPEEIQKYIGYVAGLSAAERLPVEIIAQAEEQAHREEVRSGGKRLLDFRGSITPLGTPGV